MLSLVFVGPDDLVRFNVECEEQPEPVRRSRSIAADVIGRIHGLVQRSTDRKQILSRGELMSRMMLKSKIHRATVSQADLHYVGSITIDMTLMRLADILPGEKVDIVNINNGARFSTYVIEGVENSGIIGVNGAAARLVSPGDLVIIFSYISLASDQARIYKPSIVHVNENNEVVLHDDDPAGVIPGSGLLRGDRISPRL